MPGRTGSHPTGAASAAPSAFHGERPPLTARAAILVALEDTSWRTGPEIHRLARGIPGYRYSLSAVTNQLPIMVRLGLLETAPAPTGRAPKQKRWRLALATAEEMERLEREAGL